MKTLQQAIDELSPAELKSRKARVRSELRASDPHSLYYFPGGPITYRERIGFDYPRRYVTYYHIDIDKTPEYKAWAADPYNTKLYAALFYKVNKIKA